MTKRFSTLATALIATASIVPSALAAPHFDELRRENLDKDATKFEELRRETLDK